jgi:hypothetical protein
LTDPDPEARALEFQASPLDVRYPVVDIRLEPGMDGVCIFEDEPVGDYIFGGPFFRESLPLEQVITLPAHKLEYWENSLMLDHTTPKIEKIYLRKTFPVILREFKHTINLLSKDWSGKISIVIFEDKEPIEIAFARIASKQMDAWKAKNMEQMKGSGISRKRLIAALDLLIEDGLRRQNNNPYSPTYGSLHAFYDLEAKLHRTSYWNWASTALLWCLENQYTGPDTEAIGGLVGSTPASMVGVRHYFPASCAYTTAFFGLAVLEELKLLGVEGNK